MMEDADPYFKKFIEEVMAGKICKEELAGASGWEDTRVSGPKKHPRET